MYPVGRHGQCQYNKAMTINANLHTTKDEFSRANQGIRAPKVTTLPAGQVLFRFASTKNVLTGASIPSTHWARGAWWVREHDYRKILDSFTKGKLTLGTVARSAVAVQPSWSNMDVSIKAYLLNDMKVYVGQGSTQHREQLPNGMFVTLSGWPVVEQIYVPGMRGAAFQNICILRQKIISSNSFGL